MRNSSNTQTVYQQQTHKNHFQLRFLLLPWKIYSSPLRPSYQLLLARLYHFAKSTQNNVQASLQYLAEHYGTSYGVMRNVVYEARNAGLLASGSLSFIDLETFEMPPNSDDKEISLLLLMLLLCPHMRLLKISYWPRTFYCLSFLVSLYFDISFLIPRLNLALCLRSFSMR